MAIGETADQDRETTATATERVSFRVDEPVLEELDDLCGDDGPFPNRSAALRAATRQLVREYNDGETDG
ncbi:ribbon-helix-helix domain-containing protein [Halobiforma nitratireducens]|uniref:CopG-like domain-containing protein DNA-binding domain n=1 Tax=Halobiforma nitratireducens JCM 10879 TaxID=1227454 RepID=M0LPZ5_9EURY|nr:ribbon-helix-helix domain-containing protein [Halobiforma nitratireducens]EMA34115.1 CopG-like domain-containing protein DNA-binding domain [Halobiforma nitratireducens JCM 10879]